MGYGNICHVIISCSVFECKQKIRWKSDPCILYSLPWFFFFPILPLKVCLQSLKYHIYCHIFISAYPLSMHLNQLLVNFRTSSFFKTQLTCYLFHVDYSSLSLWTSVPIPLTRLLDNDISRKHSKSVLFPPIVPITDITSHSWYSFWLNYYQSIIVEALCETYFTFLNF